MSHEFFENRDCEYRPCHSGLKKINCLFCFCPLYHRSDCGGSFTILEDGTKDCSACTVPHEGNGYGYVIAKLKEK